MVLATLNPYQDRATLEGLAKAKASAFAMEFVPRITRAQVMDALSSQANLAGYRAVIEAADGKPFITDAWVRAPGERLQGDGRTQVCLHNDAVVQGLSEMPFMQDVERWAVLTVGTGLGNASYTNRQPPEFE